MKIKFKISCNVENWGYWRWQEEGVAIRRVGSQGCSNRARNCFWNWWKVRLVLVWVAWHRNTTHCYTKRIGGFWSNRYDCDLENVQVIGIETSSQRLSCTADRDIRHFKLYHTLPRISTDWTWQKKLTHSFLWAWWVCTLWSRSYRTPRQSLERLETESWLCSLLMQQKRK